MAWYKLSDRILTKPEFTWHVTDKKFNTPFFNLSEDRPYKGFGGQAYGPGFYTSQNPSVIFGTEQSKGYLSDDEEKRETQTVRKQRLPKGTKIFEYNAAPQELAENIFKNVLYTREEDNEYYRERHLKNGHYDFNEISDIRDNKEELNQYLLSIGYDAIEYLPFKIHLPISLKGDQKEKFIEEHSKKGNNILIINPKLLADTKLFELEKSYPERFKPENIDSLPESIQERLVRRDNKIATYNNLIRFMKGGVNYYSIPEEVRPDPGQISDLLRHTYEHGNMSEAVYNINFKDLPKEIQNDDSTTGWPYLYMKYTGGIYDLLPHSLKLNPLMILIALSDNFFETIKKIPPEVYSDIDTLEKILIEYPDFYSHIPQNVKNNIEYRNRLLKGKGAVFPYAHDEGHLTPELVRTFIPSNSYEMRDIPEEFVTDDYIKHLIETNPSTYTILPREHKTIDNLILALRNNISLWYRLLSTDKTPEILEQIAQKDPELGEKLGKKIEKVSFNLQFHTRF